MSRCFPFPPPGYEKKLSNVHDDLLIKEKQKEKKHRKEKDKEKRESKERKDKEKRESKERKDKDRSKDKHREKKDKKDKHRDKDKKKHKDGAKDKKKNLNERKSEGYTGGLSEGNLGEGRCEAEYPRDPKFTEGLGRKLRDEENGVDKQMVEKIVGKVRRPHESMGSSAEKNGAGNKMVTGNKTVQNITIPEQKMHVDSIVGKSRTDDEMHQNGADCQLVGEITGRVEKEFQSMERSAEKKGSGYKMVAGNKMVQNLTLPDQKIHAAGNVGKNRTDDEMHQNGADSQLVGRITGRVQKGFESMESSAEKKDTGNKMVAGNKMVQNLTTQDQKMHMASFMGKRRRTEEEMLQNGADSQLVGKNSSKFRKTFESIMGSSAEEKGTGSKLPAGNKMVHNVRAPEQKVLVASAMEKRATEDGMLQETVCGEQRRVNVMDRPMAQDKHKKIERKDRTKEQELDGHNEKSQEKVQKEKNKERDKEKKKEKEKRKDKHKEQVKQVDIQKKEQEDSPKVGSLFIPEGNVMSACADGSLKRKQINGFLHENEIRCNKLPRLSSSSELPLENGRKPDQCLTGSPCAPGSHKSVNLVKVEKVMHEENKVNGVIDIQPPSAALGPRNSSAIKNGGRLKRPPHPDEKYLSEILCVPKMEEWLEFDDQDWLLSRGNIQQNPKTPHRTDESQRVWASALRIEAADVLALPYVVPY